MSLDAYHRRQTDTEAPRETEYRLFGRVTGALLEARDKEYTGGQLMKALDWNRRMWAAFANDCALPDNQLPEQTRAQIISLSIYVSKTSSKVMRGEASINDLIEINRNIMQGLAQQAEQTRQAQASGPTGEPSPDTAGPSEGSPLPSGGVVS